jgi:dolichol-phosphate mannosyltransferase
VIPTRNEVDNMEPLLTRLAAALAHAEHEIVVVDDSDDGTEQRIAALTPGRHEVTVIHRDGPDRSGGLSTAVVRGLHRARGEFVCVMDADLQHPPEMVAAMLAAGVAGADLVVASRYVKRGSNHGLEGWRRRVLSRAATSLAQVLFSEARRSSDPLSGFFLCRCRVLDGIEFRPAGFKILLELLVCVPGIGVVDLPLRMDPRAAGHSKAGAEQGLLYLSHLRSLFWDVRGSARMWKFAMVGLSGLAVLLPLIALLSGPAHLPAPVAFIPAFGASLVWNTALNRAWTFADQRRGFGNGGTNYFIRGLVTGLLAFAGYSALVAVGLPPVVAALASALSGMVINGLVNRSAIRRRPRLWSDVVRTAGVQAALHRIAVELGADRTYLLPSHGASPAALPAQLVDRVATQRRAVLFVEAPSFRAQRRSNVTVASTLLVPVIAGGEVGAVLVCERVSSRPFDDAHLDAAMTAAHELTALLGDDDPDAEELALQVGAGRV